MNLNRRLLLAAAAALWLASPSLAQADIRFGVPAEPFPPYASKDASGKWVGWEIDLMDKVCAKLKEKCELVEVAWDGIIPALNGHQIDVIWASMLATPERRKVIDFSNWYYNLPAGIAGAKNGDKDLSPEHLAGKIIGAQVSTVHQQYVDKHYGARSTIKTYQTQDEATQDLTAGRLDYVQASSAALEAFLKTPPGMACCELKGLITDDPDLFKDGVAAGIRKDDPALKAKLDTALSELAKTDAFDTITAKYPELAGKIVYPRE